MFWSSHDSIIKENMNKIMQITAFKAILARRINIKTLNIKNTFARIESPTPPHPAPPSLLLMLCY